MLKTRVQDLELQVATGTRQGGAMVSGGGGGEIAYCKTDAPDSDEIPCYRVADLAAWSAATTYAANDWVEVAGTEYKSLQPDNLNRAVTDTDWWEEGTISVTVRCLIYSGSSLLYAAPPLKNGDEILVHKVGEEWICPGFTGTKVIS